MPPNASKTTSRRPWRSIILVVTVIVGAAGVVIGVSMFKERFLPVASFYLLRIMLSAVLVWIASTCLFEVYRMWAVRNLSLANFAYVKDGSDAKDTGTLFTQEVNQDLRTIHRLVKGEPRYRAPSDGRVRPETIGALASDRSSLGDLEIPSISNTALADLEIQIQGVKVTDLFRTLTRLVHPPDEIGGMVSERNSNFTAQVELRQGLTGSQPSLPPQECHDRETRQDLSFAVASRILYLLAADRDSQVLTKYTPEELELYLRALRQFDLYSVFQAEARIDASKKQEAALTEADRLLSNLAAEKTQLDPAYKLAALVAFARGDGERGKALLDEYVRRIGSTSPDKQDDPSTKKLQTVVGPPTTQGAADPRVRSNTVRPGISVSSVKAIGATICCIVKDKSGGIYLLSSDQALFGAKGTEVVQPSIIDGGKSPEMVVAEFTKAVLTPPGERHVVAGAIARLRPKVRYEGTSPECPFVGVGTVVVGDTVTLVGRTSGRSIGKVIAVNTTRTIGGIPGVSGFITFEGLVECVGEGDKQFSQPGD